MKNVAYAAIIIVIALPALAVDDSYICVADQSAGFSYDEATMAWKRVSFDVSQSKYLIKRRSPENDAAGAFGVYLLGADLREFNWPLHPMTCARARQTRKRAASIVADATHVRVQRVRNAIGYPAGL